MVHLLLLMIVLNWMVRGIEQGVLWSKEGTDSFKWNEHILFVIHRVVFISVIAIATFVGIWQAVGVCIAGILLFPFFHNGAYYEARKRIAKENNTTVFYPKGWRSNPSKGSTALINIYWQDRWILAIIGVVVYGLTVLLF